MKYILDKNGEPQHCEDVMKWGRWYETAERRVAFSEVGAYVISTVFLGLDYSVFGGPPLVWETMAFKGREGEFFDRCSGTREQAEAMHEKMCKQISKMNNATNRIVHEV